MDPNEWLEDNAFGYSDLSPAERDAINYFALLWACFEGTKLQRNASPLAIEGFVDQFIAQNPKLPIEISNAKSYFQDRYFADGKFNAAFDALRFSRIGDRNKVQAVFAGSATDNVAVLKAVLLTIYRYRNNLFHGEKWSYGIRDQQGNFEHANNVLMAVMRP